MKDFVMVHWNILTSLIFCDIALFDPEERRFGIGGNETVGIAFGYHGYSDVEWCNPCDDPIVLFDLVWQT